MSPPEWPRPRWVVLSGPYLEVYRGPSWAELYLTGQRRITFETPGKQDPCHDTSCTFEAEILSPTPQWRSYPVYVYPKRNLLGFSLDTQPMGFCIEHSLQNRLLSWM